jgi:large subunit ribosomal protein L3
MFKGIFGEKVGMTQVYDEEGVLHPVTVIQAEPCVVVRTKSPQDREGYEAVVVGFGAVKHPTKPHSGQFEKINGGPRRHIKELRGEGASEVEVGSELTVESFEQGDRVSVAGVSKGKGFAGTVKRHNFSRGPMSHGSKSHRRPASTGGTDAARVFKGVKKPGQMGNRQVTVKGLRIVRVDPARNLLLISGSVPGPKGSIVEVRAEESFDEEI